MTENNAQPDMQRWLNRIHLGDCIETMAQMPAESIDTIVTSPPYNLRAKGGVRAKKDNIRLWKNAALSEKGYAGVHTDDMPYDEYVEWQREYISAMLRVLKPTGAIFYNHKYRIQKGLLQYRADIMEGFPVRQIIIWSRNNGFLFNDSFFLPTYEVIFLITKPKFKLAHKAYNKKDVWHIKPERKNPHPAAFPLELARNCVESTRGGIVLDPMMGSGTVAIAAEELGRDWIGIELSAEYCELANNRIIAARGEQA